MNQPAASWLLSPGEALSGLSRMASLVESQRPPENTHIGVFTEALTTVATMFKGKGAVLWLPNEDSRCLEKAFEIKNGQTAEFVAFGKGLVGQVWSDGHPRLMLHPASFAPPESALDKASALTYVSSIALRLNGNGAPCGVIEVTESSLESIDELTNRLLHVVGTLIGSYVCGYISTDSNRKVHDLESELARTKERLAAEHDSAIGYRLHSEEILRNINIDLRTQLSGIFGAVGLLHRTALSKVQAHYLSILKECTDSLISILETLSRELGVSLFTPGHDDRGNQPLVIDNSLKSIADVQPSKSLSNLRILIVTGIVGSAEFIEAYVSAAGIKYDTVGRGHLALTRMRQAVRTGRPFDVVIVEMVLPDMDALEFANAVSHDMSLSNIHLVLVSTFGPTESNVRWLKGGFSAHLSKPLKQQQLLAALQKTVGAAQTAGLGHLNADHGQPKILIAEDNPVNQKVALLQLKELGFLAKAVANGQEALNAIQHDSYDLILMDCQMPLLDGFQTAVAIRQQEKQSGQHIPIIAMTAHAMVVDRERCLASGMDDYMSKPITYEKLAAVMSRWVLVRDNR